MEFNESVLMKRECIEDVKPSEPERQRMSLHCSRCNVVLSDSFFVCGEITSLDCILCLKVTDDVIVSETTKMGRSGDLANCIYSTLKCGSCSSAVGKVVHSAPWRLTSLRSFFLLSKANVDCYVLNSSSAVKSSSFTFDQKSFRENMKETKESFETTMEQMLRLKTRIFERKASRKQSK
ncbi:unnamed protein product [Ophioblennius macclurei]